MNNDAIEKENVSSFYIPILLSKNDLEATLNKQFDGVIFDDKMVDDKVMIKVSKSGDISLSLEDTTINYKVPLHINVKREFLLGGVSADGDINLDFKTTFHFNPDWTITTETAITQYEWIVEPKARVLGMGIPITSIAERILNTSEKSVTDAIDKQVTDNFALKTYAQQAWALLQQPLLITEEYDARFKFTPSGLAITPFKSEKDTIRSTLYLKGHTQVAVGQKNSFSTNTPLLPLKIEETKEEQLVKMKITSKIPFEEVERIALKNFKGETYSFATKKLVIEDIQLSKEEEAMKIIVQTKGDYTGVLQLKGTPSYNEEKSQIEIQDIEFKIDTKNILQKAAKWLLNGLIINKLEGNLVYPIAEDLTMIQGQLQKQIDDFKIQEGITLDGELMDLKVSKAVLNEDALLLDVALKGAVKILIKGLGN